MMKLLLILSALLLIPAETQGAKELPPTKVELSLIEEYRIKNPKPRILRRPSRLRTSYRRDQARHTFEAWKERQIIRKKKRLGLTSRKKNYLTSQDYEVIRRRNQKSREPIPFPCTNNKLYNETYLPNCYESTRK